VSGTSEREQTLMRLAARQHWVVTDRQLASLGFSRHAIDHRLRVSRLFRLYRGVYAVGRRSLSSSGCRLAAVIAHGSGAVLSHVSAAAQWQLLQSSHTVIDVSVPRRLAVRPGIRLHFSSTLHPEDVMMLDRIPITSVERTLADLAAERRPEQLLEAVEQAYTLRRLDLGTMDRVLERNGNHRGIGALRAIFADFTEAPATRSTLERRMLHVVAAADLPTPLLNVFVAGLQVDMFWPDWRLVVELDSRRFHDNPWALERDRRRDTILRTALCEILRVTHRRLTREPEGVVADIRALAAIGVSTRPVGALSIAPGTSTESVH
jgi:hypothetical protein